VRVRGSVARFSLSRTERTESQITTGRRQFQIEALVITTAAIGRADMRINSHNAVLHPECVVEA
jgi:hypothetical protein